MMHYFCAECRKEVKGKVTPQGVVCENCGEMLLRRKSETEDDD